MKLLIVFVFSFAQYALLSSAEALNPSRDAVLDWLSALCIAVSATLSFSLINPQVNSIAPLNRRSNIKTYSVGGRIGAYVGAYGIYPSVLLLFSLAAIEDGEILPSVKGTVQIWAAISLICYGFAGIGRFLGWLTQTIAEHVKSFASRR